MLIFDAVLLLLFSVFSITEKEWMGWQRLGAQNPPELPQLFLVLFVILYVLISTFLFFLKNKLLYITKIILFVCVITTLVAAPLFYNIAARHTSVNYLLIHDGALQTEIAARFLFKGKNPYSQNYLGTPLEQWRYSEPGNPKATNPALYHYAYLPFFLLTSTAGHLVQKVVLGWEDLRFTLFAEYLLLLLVVWLLTKNLTEKFLYLVLFGANPLVVHFLLEGRNDTASFLYLLASAFFLYRKNLITSAILLGFCVSFKQTLWLSVPFFLGYVFFEKDIKSKARTYLLVFLATSLIFILPFFLWDPKSFIDSTIGYMSGTTIHSYPMGGIGFSQLLLATRIVPNSHNYFPFWIFQLGAVIPFLFVFLKLLKRTPKLSSVFLFFSATTLLFFYFSRSFSDSYITLIFLSLVTAMLFYQKEK